MVFKTGKKGNKVVKSVGAMVGLLLGLYVFDLIIAVVLPLTYNCGSISTNEVSDLASVTVDWTANTTAKNCVQYNASTSKTATIPSPFGTALTFLQNLFPIVGILGAFEIIYRALQRSGMM